MLPEDEEDAQTPIATHSRRASSTGTFGPTQGRPVNDTQHERGTALLRRLSLGGAFARVGHFTVSDLLFVLIEFCSHQSTLVSSAVCLPHRRTVQSPRLPRTRCLACLPRVPGRVALPLSMWMTAVTHAGPHLLWASGFSRDTLTVSTEKPRFAQPSFHH